MKPLGPDNIVHTVLDRNIQIVNQNHALLTDKFNQWPILDVTRRVISINESMHQIYKSYVIIILYKALTTFHS